VQTRAAEVAGEILSITAVQISWRIGLELTKIRAKFTVRPVDGQVGDPEVLLLV
jgi:hypothetical protein